MSDVEQLRAELAEVKEQLAQRDDQYRVVLLCLKTVAGELEHRRTVEAVDRALDEFNRRWPPKE